ncbi:LysR substrate-binding domain-containing protein [Rickettsiales bacterium]|nr:LysR substrate-binding domain-containing protein [Rickettsiales bacterium]
MNIRDFKYLIAIDEVKSFVKAAEKCNVSQPALSQQVKRIELQLDCTIFERNQKEVVTTKKGQIVLKHAHEIINSFKQIKTINQSTPPLNIGLIPTICPYLLPLIVDSIKAKLPDYKIYFHELKTEELIQNLKSGEIEIGIIAHFPHLIDSKLFYQKLYDEDFLLALPKDSNLSEKDFGNIIATKQLMLLTEGNCMSENIKDICSIYKNTSYSDFSATNIETIKNMIKINNGAGLLPELSCLDEQNLKLIKFAKPKFREIGLIARSSFANKEIISNLTNLIKNNVSKLD